MNPSNEPEMEEREKLIALVSEHKAVTEVNSATWACFWFADVAKLKELVLKLTNARGGSIYEALYTDRAAKVMKSLINMSELANGPLLIKDLLNPVATSAYSKFLKQEPGADFLREQLELWDVMRTFWRKETILPWTAALYVSQGQRATAGMFSLSCEFDRLWRQGRFGLQPLGVTDGGKTLEARFFWLPRCKYSTGIPLMTRPSLASDSECFRLSQQFGIDSGDVVVFKTDNLKTDPLPSRDLLHMQWVLNRVLAASGVLDLIEEEAGNESSSESSVDSFKSFEENDEVKSDDDEEEDEVNTESSSSEEDPDYELDPDWTLW